jgi:ribosomal protein S18 acetylase RimI-like enzyme
MTSPHTSHFDVAVREARTVRPLESSDRPRIVELLRSSMTFTADEIETAIELIDESLAGDPEYIVNVLATGDHIAGYECHGPTPLTVGTFDLYWIVVDPRAQRRGFGRLLLRAAEEDALRRGGRLLVIETSSQPSYAATVQFYKRNGYQLEARIHDFYRPSDDKLVLVKALHAS